MKLLTYILNSDDSRRERIGVLKTDGKTVIDLQAAHISMGGKETVYFNSMLDFLDGGDEAMELAKGILKTNNFENVINPDDLTLLAPVPRPRSIRDTLCYELHMIQSNKVVHRRMGHDVDNMDPKRFKPSETWYERPLYYKGNPASVVGQDAEIYFPEGEGFRDYELELGFYIGKKGKNISKAEAEKYIAGHTIFNDFSSRDIQSKEMYGRPNLGPAKGKDFDTGNVMGPYLVTPDEFDPNNSLMVVRVNGVEWGRGNSGSMYHKIPDIIAYISLNETLYPGDFIGTGTVGNGCGLEFDKPIYPGDIVELEIEGIGILRNKIAR